MPRPPAFACLHNAWERFRLHTTQILFSAKSYWDIRGLTTTIRLYVAYEFISELKGWLRIARYHAIVTALLSAATIFVLVYVKPFPPKNAYLATGQAGSSYRVLGEGLKTYFSSAGFDLNLVQTNGLTSGFNQLRSDASPTDASFVAAGMIKGSEHPNIVSLGSVQIAPIWLFIRGERIGSGDDLFAALAGKRVGIGLAGSAANQLFRRILELGKSDGAEPLMLIEEDSLTAAEHLSARQLDAVFLIDGPASSVIRKLVSDRSLSLHDFTLADAYIARLSFLEKVVLPRGAFDIASVSPARDITLLATTITLLVEKRMHPALQWAFLLAVQDTLLRQGPPSFFRTEVFPRYTDLSVPLSDVAQEFYTSGAPAALRVLPLWAGTLVAHFWGLTLLVWLIALPILSRLALFRKYSSQHLLYGFFRSLRHLEQSIPLTHSVTDAEALVAKLDLLDSAVVETWVNKDSIRHIYSVRKTIESVRAIAVARLASLRSISSDAEAAVDA